MLFVVWKQMRCVWTSGDSAPEGGAFAGVDDDDVDDGGSSWLVCSHYFLSFRLPPPFPGVCVCVFRSRPAPPLSSCSRGVDVSCSVASSCAVELLGGIKCLVSQYMCVCGKRGRRQEAPLAEYPVRLSLPAW